MLEIGSPKETSFIKIKKFADQFLNADSYEEDVKAYEAELTVVMDELKVCRRKILWAELTLSGRHPLRYILPLQWIGSIKRRIT